MDNNGRIDKLKIFFFFFSSIAPEDSTATILAGPSVTTSEGHLAGHLHSSSDYSAAGSNYFKLTSAATPISASFGHHHSTAMVDGMMSSAFAAAAAAHQDSLSRMTSMTNSIAPPQTHASHAAGQILGKHPFKESVHLYQKI